MTNTWKMLDAVLGRLFELVIAVGMASLFASAIYAWLRDLEVVCR